MSDGARLRTEAGSDSTYITLPAASVNPPGHRYTVKAKKPGELLFVEHIATLAVLRHGEEMTFVTYDHKLPDGTVTRHWAVLLNP